MSFDYSDMARTATELIKEFGGEVIWREVADPIVPNSGQPQPWRPTAGVPTDYAVQVAFFPNTKENREALHYSSDSDVPTGTELGLLGPVDFTPTLKGIVLRGGEQLPVTKINPLRPNGVALYYTLEFDV